MSDNDKSLLKEIQKSLIIYFIITLLGALGSGVVFYYRANWRMDQAETNIEMLKATKVDKEIYQIQMGNIDEKLDDIKKALENKGKTNN